MGAGSGQRAFAPEQGPSRTLVLPLLGAMVLLAWVALAWLEQSDYGTIFHQHGGGHSGHQGHSRVSPWVAAIGFIAGWLLMTVAMMLPTTLPLIGRFHSMVAARRRSLLVGMLIVGYLGAWLLVGLAALGFTSVMQMPGVQSAVFRDAPWALSAVLLLLAGGFQFSRLKYACLERCRTPLGFLASHWHGRREVVESFNIGWRHGLYCVGCCWALMLLMFAVSSASLAWMLILAVVMAAEKNLRWGVQLVRPLGLVLIASGALVIVTNLDA